MTETIHIDGSHGEGGGQILRTSLCLSALTRAPVRLSRIRAGRRKPGLRRQHLTALRTIGQVCGARIEGDELGSSTVHFTPGPIRAGDYHVRIGTAGSTTLVLQTVCWALLRAPGPSSLVIEGGTHNPMAPSADFLIRTFLPAARRLGARLDIRLGRHGFYPAGGGRLEARFEPSELSASELLERGAAGTYGATALIANLPASVARRELEALHGALGWSRRELKVERVESPGPGNALCLDLRHAHLTTVITRIGEKGVLAEEVARQAAREARTYLDAPGAAVDEHLADQLLIPMAIAGGGAFTTTEPSLHTRTNAAVIARFLPVEFDLSPAAGGAWRVQAQAR